MTTTADMATRILALYKFVSPKLEESSLKALQQDIECFCLSHNVRGTLILSTEGINGTICYPLPKDGQLDAVFMGLKSRFPGLRTRISSDHRAVFARLRVKVKKEIVTIGNVDANPNQVVGEYVKPGAEWDALLKDPECFVVDTRNDYEVRIGTFEGAVNPHTDSFVEFPEWIADMAASAKKIAMFCTGGIRCEKSTSFLKKKFPDKPVYHLEGGILAYLAQVPAEQSSFLGECYVFDQRVAVTHGLLPSQMYTSCFACRQPLSPQDREDSRYQEGLSCPYCANKSSEKQLERFQERNKQIELSAKLGKPHIHDSKYETIDSD
jgi:UPF0176 protein